MTYALSIPGKRHQTLLAISQANQSYGWTLAKYNETENQAFLPTALAIIETKMKKKVRTHECIPLKVVVQANFIRGYVINCLRVHYRLSKLISSHA